MNLPKHISSYKKGFTLIELLIVIGILGILAVGLLAALDPIDQLRRGRDSARRASSTELAGALNRYYAVTGTFPWGLGNYAVQPVPNALINTLIDAGELKTGFDLPNQVPAAQQSSIQSVGAPDSELWVCFDPEAKSGDIDQSSLYQETVNPPTSDGSCPESTDTPLINCYFCAH